MSDKILTQANNKLSDMKLRNIEKMWGKTRNNHNFILGNGEEDLIFYSVEFFDENVS